MDFRMKPIGIIHTPFSKKGETPIQPSRSNEEGRVEVFPEYAEGLDDVGGFSRIMLIYAFHRSEGFRLKVRPFLDKKERGLFATRAPRRPNPIGVSEVRLLGKEGNTLKVSGVDMLDNTPLLDIKPCIPGFTGGEKAEKIGWLKRKLEGGCP